MKSLLEYNFAVVHLQQNSVSLCCLLGYPASLDLFAHVNQRTLAGADKFVKTPKL